MVPLPPGERGAASPALKGLSWFTPMPLVRVDPHAGNWSHGVRACRTCAANLSKSKHRSALMASGVQEGVRNFGEHQLSLWGQQFLSVHVWAMWWFRARI